MYFDENVRNSQAEKHPNLHPGRIGLHGQEFWVISVADLLRLKLSSFRDKDRVHVRGMDAAGLITSDVERSLGDELRDRLVHVRDTE